MRICETVREVCDEMQRGTQRDAVLYHEAFGKRARAAEDAGDGEVARSCRLLAAVFSMYFKRGPDGPFGPLVVWPNGSRSVLPKDLKPEDAAQLEKRIDCAADPVFVARIADVLWIATKNHQHARRALRAYLTTG
jgi:hypothetical protein